MNMLSTLSPYSWEDYISKVHRLLYGHHDNKIETDDKIVELNLLIIHIIRIATRVMENFELVS